MFQTRVVELARFQYTFIGMDLQVGLKTEEEVLINLEWFIN